MSKISQLAMELDEQAMDMGYDSFEEAIRDGYEVDYQNHVLVKPSGDQLEQAHKDWEGRKKQTLHKLIRMKNEMTSKGDSENIKNAIMLGDVINFIEEGEI